MINSLSLRSGASWTCSVSGWAGSSGSLPPCYLRTVAWCRRAGGIYIVYLEETNQSTSRTETREANMLHLLGVSKDPFTRSVISFSWALHSKEHRDQCSTDCSSFFCTDCFRITLRNNLLFKRTQRGEWPFSISQLQGGGSFLLKCNSNSRAGLILWHDHYRSQTKKLQKSQPAESSANKKVSSYTVKH